MNNIQGDDHDNHNESFPEEDQDLDNEQHDSEQEQEQSQEEQDAHQEFQQESQHEEQYETPQHEENESEQQQEQEEEESKEKQLSETKKQAPKKKRVLAPGEKDFVAMNKRVKTFKEIQQESIEKQKTRFSELSQRKSQQSLLVSRMSTVSLSNKEDHARLPEWNNMVLKNNILDRQLSKPNIKNQSNDFITKEASESLANSLGQVYSRNQKERSYQKTNSSAIMTLPSYKTLDGPAKVESYIVPEILGNVELKQNLELRSSLDNPHYQRKDANPEEYYSYQPKKQIVHNVNNTQVQNMRLRNYNSQVF